MSTTEYQIGQCECSDPGCHKHKGDSVCHSTSTTILYRIDIEDNTGTEMCDECAEDATDSGLFAEYDPDLDETDLGD